MKLHQICSSTDIIRQVLESITPQWRVVQDRMLHHKGPLLLLFASVLSSACRKLNYSYILAYCHRELFSRATLISKSLNRYIAVLFSRERTDNKIPKSSQLIKAAVVTTHIKRTPVPASLDCNERLNPPPQRENARFPSERRPKSLSQLPRPRPAKKKKKMKCRPFKKERHLIGVNLGPNAPRPATRSFGACMCAGWEKRLKWKQKRGKCETGAALKMKLLRTAGDQPMTAS